MNYTKAVKHLLKRYRASINPPYQRKDYGVLAVTFFILLALPIAVLLSQNKTNSTDYAATLPPVPSVAVQHYMLHGKEFFPPFAATDPGLVARGAKGSPNEKHGTGLLLPTQLGSASGGGGSTKGGKKPTPTPTVPFATATPGPLTPTSTQSSPTPTLSNLPASVDLSQYAVPVGDQGPIGSCTAWATDYNQRGWYAVRDGYNPLGPINENGNGGFAPMYTYSQATGGKAGGTWFSQHYDIMQSQGVDARADYDQGDIDYFDQPTSTEIAAAAKYKISSYTDIYPYSNTSATEQSIKSALASGNPVAIALIVIPAFTSANSSQYLVDVPSGGSCPSGLGHAVVAEKYDQNGLWIENQWGTGWGLNGWAELSWNFVNNASCEYGAYTINPVTPSITPTITPTPAPITLSQVGSISTGLSTPQFVTISGNYAYVLNRTNNSMVIYDITNPSNPVYLSSINTGMNYPESVTIAGGYAYVASESNNSLVIFNIANPASPVFVGSATTGLNSPTTVAVSGSYAYVASYGNNSIITYNISNPSTPIYQNSITGGMILGLSGPYSITIAGKYMYVTNNNSYSSIMDFDISNPASPVYLGNGSGYTDSYSTTLGNITYATGNIGSSFTNNKGLLIYKMTYPTSIVQESGTTSGLSGANSVAVSGNYAYVTSSNNNSLVAFNVSVPYAPIVVASTNSGLSYPSYVAIAGNYAYVASSYNNSLVVFSIQSQ